ncbi:imidazole glycerol phosphate synthase [Steroidobacter denitrificans]|uniref:Imidazole glycerol phosphate synthase subunit HisH n=1 Tax=Steroidobacter denitrificans TaxID=465721 RepID=A0A127FBP0_STEDE|nr:imidazole glycerol phosphate synthase subunit HisH [Steroidobacter denitrificans]AMN46969.1 imidazole glycerol phosphate synthase [Steroidobacter denitrificans]
MTRLAIIDSGGANIASLQFAIDRLGVSSTLTTDAQVLRAATHVILPGVGAAADCMSRLRQAGLVETIRTLTQPLLGICVGMQLLFESSEEGDTVCLGLLPGRVRRFAGRAGFPVPHIGWNQLEFDAANAGNPLLAGLNSGDHMYFVHSYAAPPGPVTLARTTYGEPFSALVQQGNVQGAQFHPERSARNGACLLGNFLRL